MMQEDSYDIRYLYSEAFCYDDDKIWFSAMRYNGLYCLRMEENRVDFIGNFPGEKHSKMRLHGKALKVKNEIYFLPDNSNYLHVYNINLKKFSSYNLNENKRIGCRNGFYYKDKVYFIVGIPDIAIFTVNVITKEIRKRKLNIDNGGMGIGQDIVLINENAYFSCKGKNLVVKYSCILDTYQVYQIDKLGEEGYGTICYDGKNFWLSSRKRIVRWNPDSLVTDYYDDFPKKYGMIIKMKDSEKIRYVKGFSKPYIDLEFPFAFSIFFLNKVWMFPFRVNMIVQIDIETGKMEEFYLEQEYENKTSLLDKYRCTHCHYFGGIENNKLFLMSTKSKKMRIIEQENNIKEYYLKYEKKEDIIFYLSMDDCDEDEKDCTLIDFLGMNITELKMDRKNSIMNSKLKKLGNSIYTFAKNM